MSSLYSNNSDTTMQVRTGGAGMPVIRMCDGCGRPKNQVGGTIRRRGTLRLFNCAACTDKRAAGHVLEAAIA